MLNVQTVHKYTIKERLSVCGCNSAFSASTHVLPDGTVGSPLKTPIWLKVIKRKMFLLLFNRTYWRISCHWTSIKLRLELMCSSSNTSEARHAASASSPACLRSRNPRLQSSQVPEVPDVAAIHSDWQLSLSTAAYGRRLSSTADADFSSISIINESVGALQTSIQV